MITGVVAPKLEAIIRVHVEDGKGQTQALDVKIDTGFTGFMCLPIAVVAALGLTLSGQENMQLADGSVVRVPVHSGVVIWDGRGRRVDVHAMGMDRTIGMGMLASHDLAIRVSDGGPISISLIP